MFTKKELQVLHDALVRYKGPFDRKNYKEENLTHDEIKYHKKAMKTRKQLINRFEELIRNNM